MRNIKKAGVLAAITVVLAGVAYLGSAGYFHLGGLSSSSIRGADACTEASQKKKKSTYDLYVKQRDTAQVKIDSYNGEIAILEGSKTGPNADKAKAEADIGTATSAKTTAETFIKNNCTPKPKNAGLKTQCDMNKTNLATANSNLSKAKVAKSRVELKIAQIDAKITAKKNAIKLQEKTRDRNKAYIEAYEECEKSLSKLPPPNIEIDNAGGSLQYIGIHTGIYSFEIGNNSNENMYVHEFVFVMDTKGVHFQKFGTVAVNHIDSEQIQDTFTCSPSPIDNTVTDIHCVSNSKEGWSIGKNGAKHTFGLDPYVTSIEIGGRNTTLLLKDVVYSSEKDKVSLKKGFTSLSNRSIEFNAVEQNICGNNIVEGTEQCDDGNKINDDRCDNICQITAVQSISGYSISCSNIPNNSAAGCNVCKRSEVNPESYFAPMGWFQMRTGVSNEEISLTGSSITSKTYQGVHASKTGNITNDFDLVSSSSKTQWTWASMKENQSITMYDVETTVNFKDPVYGVFFKTNSSLRGIPNSEKIETTCLFIYAKQGVVCGNNIVEGTEQCDDGNTVNGDGCSSLCKIESALSCVDSDGGRKEYIKAITTGFSVYPDEGYTSKGDYCIQKKTDGTFNLDTSLRDPYSAGQVSECTNNCAVMENSCSPANIIVADVIKCPSGCSDGACVKAVSLPVEISRQKNQDTEDLGFFYLEPNTDRQKIGSFIIKNPNITEDVRVTEVTLDLPSLYYNNGAISNMLTSGNTAPVVFPQSSNIIPVTFIVEANSERVFDIYADSGTTTQIPMHVVIKDIKSIGVTTNTVNKTPTGYGYGYYDFNIQSTLMEATSAQYDPAQYIVPQEGIYNSQVKYCFTTNGGYANITELKFQISKQNTIRTIKVGDINTSVIADTAWLKGMNTKINPRASSCIDVQIMYNSVGEGSVASGTQSSLNLKSVIYEVGGVKKEIEPSLGHLMSTMTLVGTKPVLSINTTPRNGLYYGPIKIGEITVSADSSGSIKINDIVYKVRTSGFDIPPNTIQAPRLQNNYGSIAFRCSANEGLIITCQYGTDSNEDGDGYEIPAGTSHILSLFGTPKGASFDGVTGASLSTSLDQSEFNWDDTSTNGQSGTNLTGSLIYGFPTGSFTVTQ